MAPFQASRSSAVYHLPGGRGEPGFFVKIYTYKRFRQVWRGLLRNTFLGPSRARREWTNGHRLRRIGVSAPAPLLLAERRRFRFLRGCAIATEWIEDATTLDRYLLAHPADASVVGRAVGDLAARMHAERFADRDLHPRNILVTRDGTGVRLHKIDSPAGHPSARFDAQVRDLASLDVGGVRLVRRTVRWRAWRSYAAARDLPRATWRRWLTAIETERRRLDPREGPRVVASSRPKEDDSCNS